MADDLGERCEELAHEVLAPLVLGGRVNPVRPFGGPLGLRLGIGRRIADVDLATRLDVARVRRARLFAPVDTVPELDEADWAALAAFNDLLQITNHHLSGPLTRGRHARLALNLRWLIERLPGPRDVLGALSRHATFARALEIARTDSTVSWWTGSAKFRGEEPPSRLLAWREIRRVRVDARRVPLVEMPLGMTGVEVDDFVDLVGLWLTRTPLTDLATATRVTPRFAWSASTLALVTSGPGRMIAFRALAHEAPEAVLTALNTALHGIPAGYEEARRVAEAFTREVARGFAALAGKPLEQDQGQKSAASEG